MKKVASIIILVIFASGCYLASNHQNTIPACSSDTVNPKLNILVRQILNQASSQKSITFEVADIKETKVYDHSRFCKATLNFKDGTNTSISYAIENNKSGKIEVRIIPGG